VVVVVEAAVEADAREWCLRLNDTTMFLFYVSFLQGSRCQFAIAPHYDQFEPPRQSVPYHCQIKIRNCDTGYSTLVLLLVNLSPAYNFFFHFRESCPHA
jgi:hypothetical protein